jgi:hypothetical protein
LALSQLTQATITSAVAAFSALAGPSNAARLEALLQKVFSTHVAPQQQAAGVPISAQQQPATAQSGGATTAAAEAAQGTGGATSLAAGAQAEAGTDAALATGGQEGSAVEVVEEAGGVLSVELEPISDKEARKVGGPQALAHVLAPQDTQKAALVASWVKPGISEVASLCIM